MLKDDDGSWSMDPWKLATEWNRHTTSETVSSGLPSAAGFCSVCVTHNSGVPLLMNRLISKACSLVDQPLNIAPIRCSSEIQTRMTSAWRVHERVCGWLIERDAATAWGYSMELLVAESPPDPLVFLLNNLNVLPLPIVLSSQICLLVIFHPSSNRWRGLEIEDPGDGRDDEISLLNSNSVYQIWV